MYNQCNECQKNNYLFNTFFCNLSYANPVKKLLHVFKYQKQRNLAYVLGFLLYHILYEALNLDESPIKVNYDVIIPMPLHRSKQKERGFNQVEDLLYYYLFKKRSNPILPHVDNTIIHRIKNTQAQAQANYIERKANLTDAFALLKPVNGLRILLVDDVVTTGSSMNEVTRLLKQNGAKKVDICALLRA
jgi:ComF family protein